MAASWTSRTRKRKLFALSIDGVPFSLLREAFAKEEMPEFGRLSREGAFVRMNSVIPTISSVAWATFMTGVNPGKHNVYGFVDRDEEMRFTIASSRALKAKTLWQRLNQRSKRTIVMNLPVTYPPMPVNGILVSGFLGSTLDRSAYPQQVAARLKDMGYIIDPDPWKAKEDREGFLEDCFAALRARKEAALEFMEKEDWDFFMLHVMGTDRVNHFYWDGYEDEGSPYHERFWGFYREVDQAMAEVRAALPKGCKFLILSDHGFCRIKREVDVNAYLCEQGVLNFKERSKEPADIDPVSKAYSLIPGRIYINLRGRELTGTVEPEEYEGLREEITESLLDFTDPETGAAVIEQVYKREELYDGPCLDRAADLIAHPYRGYDLKAKMEESPLFSLSHRVGMHTYDDASLFIEGHDLEPERAISIVDVTPTIFDLMGLPIPDDLDGRSLLKAGL